MNLYGNTLLPHLVLSYADQSALNICVVLIILAVKSNTSYKYIAQTKTHMHCLLIGHHQLKCSIYTHAHIRVDQSRIAIGTEHNTHCVCVCLPVICIVLFRLSTVTLNIGRVVGQGTAVCVSTLLLAIPAFAYAQKA